MTEVYKRTESAGSEDSAGDYQQEPDQTAPTSTRTEPDDDRRGQSKARRPGGPGADSIMGSWSITNGRKYVNKDSKTNTRRS
jgi:hypothetical protein